MTDAQKIASLNIGSMETAADARLSSDPAYLASRVAELERELRLVRGIASQADATIDQLAKQRDAHMTEIQRARDIIEQLSSEREASEGASQLRRGVIMTDATKASEVAERLEAKAEQHRFAASQSSLGDGSPYKDAAELFEAAASLIRAQSERERVLVEALKPFAKLADEWSPSFNDTQGFVSKPIPTYEVGDLKFQHDFTMGDLRAAQALTKAQP